MKSILGVFSKILKKHGFTLAEALIVTVMAGYCILPILGTMQNASVKAEAYDHYSKMLQYTRSRLTKEIANAAFDHRTVSTETKYHYVVYFDKSGVEENATRIEVPETSVTPEDLKCINTNRPSGSYPSEEACSLFGLKNTSSSSMISAYLRVVYAYKTTVQIKDHIDLEQCFQSVTSSDKIDSPKGLMGIVVTTRLIEDDGDEYDDNGKLYTNKDSETVDENVNVCAAPVSNFSLVNLPTVSDEYIWVCDSLNLKLIAIDPVSKTVASTIALPRSAKKTDKPDDKEHDSYRPWRIALHPSGKIMAVLLKNNIMYVNLDKKSPDYGKWIKQYESDTSLAFCNPGEKAQEAIKDGGVAFRPDGKYFFLTKKDAKQLLGFKLDYEIDSSTKALKWSTVNAQQVATAALDLDDDKNKYVGLVASSNGYLYLAYKDKDKDLGVYRTSMYPPNDDFVTQWSNPAKIGDLSYGKDLMGIAVSPAGNILAVVLDDEDASADNVLIFDANTGALLDKKAYDDVCRPAFVANANATNGINDRTLTLNVTNKECKEDVIATSLAIGNDRNEDYGKYKSSLNNGGPGKGGGSADKKFKGYQIIPSPITGELVINEKDKPHLVFIKSNTKADAETIITADKKLELATGKKVDNSISDIAAIPRDILAVSSSGTITLYDMNVMKRIEDNQIIATDTPTELSMSPNGEMVIGSYGSKRSGATPFYLSDYSSGPDLSVGTGEIKKHVFDDRSQNMLFFLKKDKSGTTTASSTAVYNMNKDFDTNGDWACSTDSVYFRGDFKLSNEWERLDMIGLPKGGYMALFGKSDGTSMLEWVGRIPREYPVNANKYSLFARWVSQPSNLGQRIVPDYTPDSFSEDAVDSNTGFIAVETSKQFQVNDVVKFCDVRAGSWSGGETRYITPVLVSGTTNDGYTIKDWTTTSIGLNSGEVKNNVKLIWANGGKIVNNTYFIGFWNGGKSGSGTGNPGVVALAIGNKNYSFYSDCGKDNFSNPVSLGSGDIKVDTQLYNHPSAIAGSNYSSGGTTLVANWRRKYAINFKTEGNSNSSSFPPSHSKKLAVTYDMGTLAVLSGEDTAGGATPTVSLYDFNSSNFLNETQIEGMLIDYREKMQTGAYDEINSKVKSPDYPWPEEQESLFKKVANNCGFGASTMASFQTMSTKYDSFKAFNKHPGNFHIDDSDSISGLDGIKAKANKRFFGYIRDDKDFTLLQGIPSEDSRFFYENILLGGRVETGNNDKLYDSAFSIGLEPYQSGLLQFDQTSNGGGSWSAIFLGKNGATDAKISSNLSSASGNDISKNNILTKEYDVCGWNTLKSSQTYILKHQPTLMKAFPARTSEPKVLGVDSASMMFSRDRANPVLYISDKTNNCVWAIGRDASNNYKLVRFNLGSINLTGAMAISSDGTKLFVGCSAEATTSTGGTGTKASAKKNEIRVYNIAKPDTSVFDVSSLVKDLSTAPSPNAATYTAYLGTMSADGSPVAMAAMPFVNYSTAGAVGDYTEISNQTLKEIPVAYNGCMTIASGGLYIFPATTDNSSTTIWLFNPLESRVSKFKNVLKAPAPYSPITSYDDTLYIMGDDADGSKPTNRVQSYSVNERKAKTSIIEEPDVFNDSYMVNSVYKSDETNQLMIIRTGSEAIIDGDDPKDVFDDNMDSYWRSSTTSSSNQERWVSYSFPDSNKVTVNSAVVYNRANFNTNRLEDWELYGEDSVPNNESELTYDPAKKLMSGVCGFDVYGPYLPNSITPKGAHSTFVLYAKSAKDGGKQRGVSNLELWRTGVKRLLPVIGSISVVDLDSDKGAFQPGEIPSNSPLEGMKWSPAPASSKNLGLADIFANNNDGKKNTLRGYSSSTANDCTQWKNIIEYGGSGQRYKSTANYPWIICKFKKSESVCVVRYANFGNTSGKGGIKKFKLFGSNTTDAAPNTSDGSVPSGWEPITFTNGGEEFTGPGTAEGETVDAYVYNSYITAEIMNPQPYRYYLMQITGKLKDGFSLAGLEMFSSNSRVAIEDDYLTGLEDDNRTVIQVGKGACCATPYGLVYTGGHVAESGYATSTALLYWPHAIDKYDGTYYKNGISRSLPSLDQARYNHAMVWHKGRLYVLGGAINEDHNLAGSDGGAYAEYLDGISSGAFQWMPIDQREFKPVSSDITVADMLGFYQGVCSYGDEIFIFGGQNKKSTGFSAAAYAWNPETGRVRKLRSLPDPSNRVKFQALSPCSAVVFGSKIYIYGMNNSAIPAKPVFFEYTP